MINFGNKNLSKKNLAINTSANHQTARSNEQMKDCKSLQEIRDGIDRLDHQIIALLKERGEYVEQAAKFKKSVEAVKAPDRVAQVLSKVSHRAREVGLNEDVAVSIYKTIIESFTKLELTKYNILKE